MKETGLMFKAPLVRAILSGQKTQTRRICKLETVADDTFMGGHYLKLKDGMNLAIGSENVHIACPTGGPGDRIYVRETWADLIAVSPATGEPMAIGPGERLIEAPTSWTDGKGRTRWHFDGKVIAYRANSNVEFCDGDGFSGEFADKSDMPCWRPSIHMPKDYARIWLEITGVRLERLQSIDRGDAMAEGCPFPNMADGDDPRKWFAELWGSTTDRPALPKNESSKRYARVKHWLDTHPDTTGWAANPWVWVIDFKRIAHGAL
ncbi:hypothetical protein N5F13_00255 [Comamonas thiooxydans]|uniref:hypothetical protein n=1 Tax=Comamonas thiooxydans TaxID=363952 RepID=UPI00244873C5|nr:hypothetical protein [Comamonas thiooxydans]MDH1472912.1 hypothetical protein [Comamonas thiooxydans]